MTRPELQPRIDYTSSLEQEKPAEPEPVQPAQQFSDTQDGVAFSPDRETENSPESPTDLEPMGRRLSGGGWLSILGLLLIVVSSGGQLISQLASFWTESRWLAVTASLGSLFIIAAALAALVKEVLRLRRLNRQRQLREQATELLNPAAGVNLHREARQFCQQLIDVSGLEPQHPAVQQWANALHESQSSREVLQLYVHHIQSLADKRAQELIYRYALGSAVMIAVSPLALVDMALVAWRSLRLVNQIAAIYGVEPGYLARLRLFRQVLFAIAFAGASELIQEVGVDWISQDLTAKLSARVGQGIGVGLLTARLGIKTMALCRPLPWLAEEKPKIAAFRQRLLSKLAATVRKT